VCYVPTLRETQKKKSEPTVAIKRRGEIRRRVEPGGKHINSYPGGGKNKKRIKVPPPTGEGEGVVTKGKD